MRVGELMDGKHPFVYGDDLATKARAVMREFHLRILPVTDGEKKLLGKVSRRDIMTISSSISPILVKGIMTAAKHVASVDDDVVSTVKAMVKVDVWCAPTVTSSRENTYRGVLGLESFIKAQIEANPERLVKQAGEIMTRTVVACSPDDMVEHIWRLMQEKRFAGLPVVDDGRLVGMVTQMDLLGSGSVLPSFESGKGRYRSSPRISSVMKTGVVAVEPSTLAIRVAKVMVEKDIGRVPIKDGDGRLVGIVDREDIVRLLVR